MADESLPSYHDVVVFVDGHPYRISDNYAYSLTCTRAAGWGLWFQWGRDVRLVGGEFGLSAFRIEVAGTVICDNGKRPSGQPKPALPEGWNGTVYREAGKERTP